MDIPPTLIAKVFELGSNAVIKVFESHIASISVNKTRTEESSTGECKTCFIYQHVALASAYMRDLHSRLNPDGSIPAGLGGTIKLSQSHLKDTMTEIPDVIGAHPTIDAACRRLADILPTLASRMNNIRDEDDWKFILRQMEIAEDAAYSIPESMYRREPAKDTAADSVVVVLSAKDKAMLDIVKSAREGKITRDEAKAQVSSLVLPGV